MNYFLLENQSRNAKEKQYNKINFFSNKIK